MNQKPLIYNPSAAKGKTCADFYYLLILTIFFIGIEISAFFLAKGSYFSEASFAAKQLQLSFWVFPPIIFFCIIQLLLHVLYAFMIWCLTQCLLITFSQLKKHSFNVSVTIWILITVTLILANQYYYPNSAFSSLTEVLLTNREILKYSLFMAFSLITVLVFFSVPSILKGMRYLFKTKPILFFFSFIALSALVFNIVSHEGVYIKDAASEEKPNIIIIGVDAVRPDRLSYFGFDQPTPFIDNFLNKAAVFSEATTPIARTFPSWMSILSGAYPVTSGARFDLADTHHLDKKNLLPMILKQRGYRTIYAADETRFSNFDSSFGFLQFITPPVGVNDFILGTFNDFPLTNLFINTSWGRILFPYSYANRAVSFAYEPDSFLKMLDENIANYRQQPLFLSIHFCLTHAEYYWRDLWIKDQDPYSLYLASLKRLDSQLENFFQLLQNKQLLQHSIIILLSDHGEAFELAGDRVTEKNLFTSRTQNQIIPHFYPSSREAEDVNQSAGHGTDVLSLSQYHILLAVRTYGLEKQFQGEVPGVVSLLSIKPTLMNYLKINTHESLPQVSLKSAIETGRLAAKESHLFFESDFSPNAIRSIHPKIEEVLLEGLHIFKVDPLTTRLVVRKEMEQLIIDGKQYADLYQNWLLALYPRGGKQYIPVLVNLQNGQWTTDLSIPFANEGPIAEMLSFLENLSGVKASSVLMQKKAV